MDNKTQGTIWGKPAQFQIPASDYAHQASYVSFFGHMKVSDKEPSVARPKDPSERYKANVENWERPIWTPIPMEDEFGRPCSMILTERFKFTAEPPENYWLNDIAVDDWDDVQVPAELMALGYDIRREKEYVYKKQLDIPASWNDKTILLKFGMVYEYAKIWINGIFVRDHKGAFTSFECDITEYVKAGETAWLTVMCMHSHDSLCDWTTDPGNTEILGYAGLIDDVLLVALPKKHLKRLVYETVFDEAYANAVLKVTAEVVASDKEQEILLRLIDAEDKNVLANDVSIKVPSGQCEVILEVPVALPHKWDAEHPYLYRLEAELENESGHNPVCSIDVGFRKVERKGNNLYVNGVKTKLRGAALYGHDPILGKTFSKEQIEKIVKAAKWANINYFRTAAYPERAYLYELCDKYGIYVQECTAANFQRGTWDSQNDAKIRPTTNIPTFLASYMNQLAEMVERDRNHPSVIIWEYGNESDWGINFQAELDYLKHVDPTRLTAGTWDNSHTDLASYHYPEYDEVIPNASIYDEYIHLATHDMDTLRRDPGMRNAWGLSVQKGWNALYSAEGVVGGAIFAMSDYYLTRPNGEVYGKEYGQWGLIDAWYREKPELWLTRKGYSPVKLPDKKVALPLYGMPMALPVMNRYNHTNLKEVLFRWRVDDEKGELYGPDVAPGQVGALVLPERDWKNGDVLSVMIYEKNDVLIDSYELLVGEIEKKTFSMTCEQSPELEELENAIAVKGERFEIVFSKESGLICKGSYNGETLITSGPYLNLYGAYYKPSVFQNDNRGEFHMKPSEWKCTGISGRTEDNQVVVSILGHYAADTHRDMWGFEYGYEAVNVIFEVRIDGNGLITTKCNIENPPKECIFECGISYILNDGVDSLSWEREAEYSAYPKEHIGRPSGMANRYRGFGKDTYRVAPKWSWSYDEANYILYGSEDIGNHGTNDFIATRENIYYASASMTGKQEHVRVESDGQSVSVRVCPARDEDKNLPDGIKLTMNTELYYDLGNGSSAVVKSGDGYLGNYTYPEVHLENGHGFSVRMRLTDTEDKL